VQETSIPAALKFDECVNITAQASQEAGVGSRPAEASETPRSPRTAGRRGGRGAKAWSSMLRFPHKGGRTDRSTGDLPPVRVHSPETLH
jgi:hypothetical protein